MKNPKEKSLRAKVHISSSGISNDFEVEFRILLLASIIWNSSRLTICIVLSLISRLVSMKCRWYVLARWSLVDLTTKRPPATCGVSCALSSRLGSSIPRRTASRETQNRSISCVDGWRCTAESPAGSLLSSVCWSAAAAPDTGVRLMVWREIESDAIGTDEFAACRCWRRFRCTTSTNIESAAWSWSRCVELSELISATTLSEYDGALSMWAMAKGDLKIVKTKTENHQSWLTHLNESESAELNDVGCSGWSCGAANGPVHRRA